MARIKQSNEKKGIYVQFQERELRQYDGIRATVVFSRGKPFVNFNLPYITWQGHDKRVCSELIDALKMVGNFSAKVTGKNAGGWNGHAHPATIDRNNGLTDQKVRFPVFKYHSDPHVQFLTGQDPSGETYIEWNIDGHYFNDDIPAIRAYVAALTDLQDAAWRIR